MLHNLIIETIDNILNEKRNIKSNKLFNIIQKHKGVKGNSGVFDLHNMSDDDILAVVDWKQLMSIYDDQISWLKRMGVKLDIGDDIGEIALNDGKYILVKLRGGRYDRITPKANAERNKQVGDFEDLNKKKVQRTRNRYGDGAKSYQWQNKDADEIFHNPYFRTNDGDWTPQRKQEVMDNLRNGKRWFERK